MRILRFYIVSAIFMLLTICSTGQIIEFNHITNENGLSSNSVLAICQDAKGFIWLGTPNGLNKYDGSSIKTYYVNNSKNYPPNIYSLYSDSNKDLWVGTHEGLKKYLVEKDQFIQIKLPGIKPKPIVSYLYEDQKKNLWIGTSNGLFVIDATRDTSKIQSFYNLNNLISIADNYIKAIYEDHNGTIWIGTINGLTQLQQRNGKWNYQIFRNNPGNQESLSSSYITSIVEDGMQGLWIGTLKNGINRLDLNTGQIRRFLYKNNPSAGIVNNNIRQVVLGQDGKVWIGTQEGISIIDPLKFTIQSYQHDPKNIKSLNQNSVYSIYQDAQKSMWIGTYFGGANVSYSANTKFNLIQNNEGKVGLSNNVISGIVEDNQSNLWIGTEGGGLNKIDPQTKKITVYKNDINNTNSLSSNLIKSVYKDRDEQIWVGTAQGGGLNLFDSKTNTFKRMLFEENYEKNELSSHNEILSIFEDSKKRFWLSRTQGIELFIRDKTKLIPVKNNPLKGSDRETLNAKLKVARAYQEDNKGRLWIGTNYGLYLINENYVKNICKTDIVNCITKDLNGNLWFGLNGGLALYNQQNGNYNHNNNIILSDKKILGIIADKFGKLWLSTDKGLIKFNPTNNTCQIYKTSDGIAANEFNYNAYFQNSKGEIYFGGYNGITSFFPEQIETNSTVSKLVFTGLKVNNAKVEIQDNYGLLEKNINQTKEIKFKYNQNIFSLDFALLNFIKSNKNKYKYKLVGFEKEWTETNNTTISYGNLPYGSFRLIVMGSNNDGIWSEPLEMSIRMLPPFWLTWWAYTFYGMIILMLLFVIHRYFFFRAMLVKEEELHQVKMNFFTNVSHEILTHLTLIMTPIENVIESKQLDDSNTQKLSLVKSNTTQLLRLVRELMDFRKADTNHLKLEIGKYNLIEFLQSILNSFQELANSKKIQLTFKHKEDLINIYIDQSQIEKVFFNLINNALKFTPDYGKVTVIVDQLDNKVNISVIDNGRGIHPEYISKLFTNFFQVADHGKQNTGYGIGLALSKNIIELHKGNITVESEINKKNSYTCFKVSLQKGNEHLKEFWQLNDAITSTQPITEKLITNNIITPNNSKLSILIVEDNLDLCQLLKETFEKEYSINICNNGLEAWNFAITEIPDLILSDVMMPEMDGFELCEKIKTDTRTSHIPVILLTAKTTESEQIEGLINGADIYLTKPFSNKALALNVRNLLILKKNLRNKFSEELNSVPQIERPVIIDAHFSSTIDKDFYSILVDLIHEHIEDPEFGVTMLSRKVAMSAPILYKKIKALTDMSVNDFIKSIRMKKAAELLLKNELNVSEVSYMVGYNDRKYFSREFKKQYGKSPSEFMHDFKNSL
ncbi:MAG: two-component regulator propeller domain-containing protein [Sediminibacterium sp.]